MGVQAKWRRAQALGGPAARAARWCVAGALAVLCGTQPATAQQPPQPGRPPMPQPELEVVARFDRDGNGRLDAAERAPAREWVATQRPAAPIGPPPGPPPGAARPGGAGGPPGGPPAAAPGGGRRPYAEASPGARVSRTQRRSFAGRPLYDTGTFRTIFIDFEDADWAADLMAFYNTDVEIPSKVFVDGVEYADVGVGYRGASSFRFVPATSKRSLKLSFDLVHDVDIGGYRTVNLLNANNDPTFVRTLLYSEIARHYIPAPKVNYAHVIINGENWGVYVNAEQFNRDFLREHFGTTAGARWKVPGSPNGRGGMDYLGDDPAAYRLLYEIKTKDDPARWADLIRLFRVLHETPPEQLESALAPLLDIDGVLKFLALDVALVNTDGYWTRASDYNIYQAPDGRFHVVPHDMNEALGAAGGNVELDALVALQDAHKPLRSKLLAVPALRERYLGYVRDIAERWLDWSVLAPIVERHQALIADEVMRDTRKLYDNTAFTEDVANLRTFVERRRAFLLK